MSKEQTLKQKAAYQRAWCAKNRERVRLAARNSYYANHAQRKIAARRDYLKHRAARLLAAKAYVKANREKVRQAAHDYGVRNRALISAKNKAYRRKNLLEVQAKDRLRYQKNREQIRKRELARYYVDHEASMARNRAAYHKVPPAERSRRNRVLRFGPKRTQLLGWKRGYYERHKKRLRKVWKAARDARKSQKKLYDEAYRKKHAARIKARLKLWTIAHRTEYNAYCRRRRRTDPQYRIANNMRCRMNTALRNVGVKRDRPLEVLIGCTVRELMAHLESKFVPGMTWRNRRKWHVDHVKPIALFQLTDKAQQLEAFHWSNTQPLWAGDNNRKGRKWSPPSPNGS